MEDLSDLKKLKPLAPVHPGRKKISRLRVEMPMRKERRAGAVQGRAEAHAFIDEELEGEAADWAAEQINRIINIPVIPEEAEGFFFRLILHRAAALYHQIT